MPMTLTEYAEKFIGKPYIWGGRGGDGFDCSGFVIECLQAFGLLPQGDWTAQGLHDRLAKAEGWLKLAAPRRGAVLFFGKSEKAITHTALALDSTFMVEAGGGGKSSTTPANSAGLVRMRPVSWRSDLVDVRYFVL